MEEKTSGIIISGVEYGESDKIVNVFTPQGVVSAKMKSVKKAGAKLKFASEPFCFSEFVFSVGKVGRTVIGASLIDSFYPLRLDMKKLYGASSVLEFAKKFCRENMDCEDVFLLTVDALKNLAYSVESEVKTVVKFLIGALKDSGYALNLFGCDECDKGSAERVFFDYRSGDFFCDKCFSGIGREIRKETFCALKNLSEGKDSEDEFAVLALKLISYYVENRIDVNLSSVKEMIKILS